MMNRPHRRNALTVPAARNLLDRLQQAAEDPACRVVVLTGTEGHFCSGADLRLDARPDLELLHIAGNLVRLMTTMDKPVIARVPGLCVGIGCSLALAADLVVAGESAYFLLSFVDVALMPDGGATAFVPSVIGRARAMGMALVPERIPARQALDWGLIHRAVADEELDITVGSLAQRLADGSAAALAATKRAVNAATLGGLEDALAREAASQHHLIDTPDFAEAMAAFAEKRRPRFS